MRSGLYSGVLIALALTICVAWSSSAGAAKTQHEEAGPIAGTVVAPDTERGVVVKAGPSESDHSLGYLRNGTRVKNYLEFRNGWVKVRTPFLGAWIPISNVQPQTAPAVVSSVDQPENCLKVRDGPGSEYEVVGCLAIGDTLTLTGYWTEDNWAQVSAPVNGWVYAGQIRTSLVPSYQPSPVTVQRASVRSYPVAYQEPVVVDPNVYDYDYDYAYDYSYPVGSYIYGAYPWYWWGNRFHKKRFHGKHFKHFGKSRKWDGRNWYVNRGRNAVASIGRRGGGVRVGVGRRGGGVRVGTSRGGARVNVGRRGGGFRVGVNRGATSVGVGRRGGGVRVGTSRGGARINVGRRGGGFRVGASRGGGFRVGASRGGGFRVGGGSRGGFSGRIGGMSMRSGGGGGFRGGRGGRR